MAGKESKRIAGGARFTKQQLVTSEAFRPVRDVMNALLSEKKTYTMEEAKSLLSSFLERKVK